MRYALAHFKREIGIIRSGPVAPATSRRQCHLSSTQALNNDNYFCRPVASPENVTELFVASN